MPINQPRMTEIAVNRIANAANYNLNMRKYLAEFQELQSLFQFENILVQQKIITNENRIIQ